MPTLQLLQDGSDQGRVFACMYFPDDQVRRDALLRELAEPLRDDAAAPAPSRKQSKETIRTSDQAWRAAMAGEVLLSVAAMHDAGIEEASVGKAIFALCDDAVMLSSDDDGHYLDERPFNSIPLTEKSYYNYWAEYKSVVHFWAAHRVLEQAVPFFEIPDALTSDAQWAQFLGWSQWFLEFGCRHTSRNTKEGPLLQREGAWTVTPAVEAGRPNLEYRGEILRAQLKHYRATRYQAP